MTREPSHPVVIVGAGPTGVTAATLLAQYGIGCLVLDRWATVYAQPRAVHLDDEICRVLARLGIADEFAAISRPALGLRLLDPAMRVLAELRRDTALQRQRFPPGEHVRPAGPRNAAARQPQAIPERRTARQRRSHRCRRQAATAASGSRIVDRTDESEHSVDADYVLGCDGANSIVRAHIGSSMHDMRFEQRWLVIDVATEAELDQWDGVHQVCDPVRAGTYMRIGRTRYRWEFRLLPGETAADFRTLAALRPLMAPWISRVARRRARIDSRDRVHLPGADRPTGGDGATSCCSATPPTSLPRSSGRVWARVCVTR